METKGHSLSCFNWEVGVCLPSIASQDTKHLGANLEVLVMKHDRGRLPPPPGSCFTRIRYVLFGTHSERKHVD